MKSAKIDFPLIVLRRGASNNTTNYFRTSIKLGINGRNVLLNYFDHVIVDAPGAPERVDDDTTRWYYL